VRQDRRLEGEERDREERGPLAPVAPRVDEDERAQQERQGDGRQPRQKSQPLVARVVGPPEVLEQV
jgi:hypothetical protein